MSRHRVPLRFSAQASFVRSQVTHVHRCERCGGYELCPFTCERSSALAVVAGYPQAAPELCEECKGATR